MSADQKPEQGEGQGQFSDQSSIDPPRESPESLRAKITSLIPVRRFISRFVNDPRGRKFALGGIGLAYLLSQLPAGGGETQAAQDPTPTPTPGPKATAMGEMEASSVEKAEAWPDNPYIFVDNLDRHREWPYYNMGWGTYPNEGDRRVGTVDDKIDGTYVRSFQPYTLKYPEIKRGKGVFVGIAGVVADVVTKRFYMLTVVNGSDGNTFYPRLEIGTDINNPTVYTDEARKVFLEGLPQGGTAGDTLSSMSMGVDGKGKYLKVVVKNSVIISQNGPYIVYLGPDGYPIGGFIQIMEIPTSTPTPEPPTPTTTPVPTVTPTVTPTPRSGSSSTPEYKSFIPQISKDSAK